jgi:hypothetical protein
MGWFGGKGMDLHPLGSKLNFHEQHGLWSNVGC